MKSLLSYFLIICSISFSFSQGRIDGFYRGKSKGTVVLVLGFEDSKDYFAGRTNIELGRNLYYANLYGAYGITDDLDVSVSIPFMSSDDNTNFQDITIFTKYRLLKSTPEKQQLEVSVAAGFSTPLSNYDIGGLNDLGQQATVIESRLLLHYGLNSGWFFTLQSGFSFKFEEVPNSLSVVFKVGKASEKWYYDFFYDYQKSFGGIDYLGTPRPQNFREFGVDYHKVGGTLYKPISDKMGAYINLSYVFEGRNAFRGAAYSLGLVHNFD